MCIHYICVSVECMCVSQDVRLFGTNGIKATGAELLKYNTRNLLDLLDHVHFTSVGMTRGLGIIKVVVVVVLGNVATGE